MYLHMKFLVCLSDCNETRGLSTDFRKMYKYKISRKFCQVGGYNVVQRGKRTGRQREGRTDGRKGRYDKARRRFLQFCKCSYKRKCKSESLWQFCWRHMKIKESHIIIGYKIRLLIYLFLFVFLWNSGKFKLCYIISLPKLIRFMYFKNLRKLHIMFLWLGNWVFLFVIYLMTSPLSHVIQRR